MSTEPQIWVQEGYIQGWKWNNRQSTTEFINYWPLTRLKNDFVPIPGVRFEPSWHRHYCDHVDNEACVENSHFCTIHCAFVHTRLPPNLINTLWKGQFHWCFVRLLQRWAVVDFLFCRFQPIKDEYLRHLTNQRKGIGRSSDPCIHLQKFTGVTCNFSSMSETTEKFNSLF